MKHSLIFRMIFCSMMAALSFVLTFCEIPFIVTITLYGIPLVFVGVVFGPGYGLLTGLLAGFLEQIRYGISIQTIFWLLAPMAWGGISGLVHFILRIIIREDKVYKKVICYSVAIILTSIIANIFNSAALVLLGYSTDPINDFKMFILYAIERLVSVPIHIVIYIPVCYFVCEAVKKIIKLNER